MINRFMKWVNEFLPGLFVFNSLLMLLVLLRSAGYFHPYFPITINFIVLFAVIASIFLLGATSRTIFIIAALFWVFAALLKILKIDIWAERTAIYTFQSSFVGVILFITEYFDIKIIKLTKRD